MIRFGQWPPFYKESMVAIEADPPLEVFEVVAQLAMSAAEQVAIAVNCTGLKLKLMSYPQKLHLMHLYPVNY